MEFDQLNLKKIDNELLIRKLLDKEVISPTNKQQKDLQKKITISVRNSDYVSSINNLTLGVFFDIEKTFETIRRKGVFRYSNYETQKCIVGSVAKHLIIVLDKLGIDSHKDTAYLKSIVSLSILHESFRELRKFILAEVKVFYQTNKDKSLIKSLLAYTDF